MPSGSDFQDSVDRTREAFRRTTADGQDDLPAWGDARMRDLRPEAPHEPAEPSRLQPPVLAGLHPFFRGLLETLPEPGAEWPPARREQWLETARNIFALIYRDPAESPSLLRPFERPAASPDTLRLASSPALDQPDASQRNEHSA